MQNPLDLHRQRAELKRIIARIPAIAGDLAVQFYKARFRAEGWYDTGFVKWQARSPKAKRNKGRGILTNTARLRRSIRISKITATSVSVGTDVPYAKVHNEGFRGTVQVKAHKRGVFARKKTGTGKFTKSGKERMKSVSVLSGTVQVKAHSKKLHIPKRQYMGESRYLNQIVMRRITTEITKAFK